MGETTGIGAAEADARAGGASPLAPVSEALEDLRAGRMIILVDDEDRENEGDLVLAAEHATPEAVNFMLTVARGYMCLSLTGADCDRLDLHAQAPVNTSVRATPFTVSIDGHPKHGFTTGVSADERARTIRMAIDPSTTPDDFVRPGHINPLRARDGGVLVRAGQTEGSIDLCRLAGLRPAAVIIEIMRPDGRMARMPDLEALARDHGLKICSVAQLIEHRLGREALVRRIGEPRGEEIETACGRFRLITYDSVVDPLPHVALAVGMEGERFDPETPTLVRMHQRNLLGDIFGVPTRPGEPPSDRLLRGAMEKIQREGRGAVVYLRPEGVGDALSQRLLTIKRGAADPDRPDLTALALGASGAPLREYGIGGQILRDLGLRRIRLLTNHPRTLPGVEAFGLEIESTASIALDGSEA